MAEPTQLHSAAYMGPQRDLFWNLDHIELIGRRLGLARVESVLDIGCGQGHWGRLLDTATSPRATTVGVDFEPEWIAEATRQAQAAGLASCSRYEQGSAEALTFEDASFDLVTCQTLLIHVPDPEAVIAEMFRVVKPGGLVLAAEPNNRAGLLVEMAPTCEYSSDAPVRRLQFYLTCERGKVALGQGNNSVGDLLPGYFAQAGLVGVEAFLADKTWPLVPPYETEEQQSFRSLLFTEAEDGTWGGWTRDQARTLFCAGGGETAQFDAEWEARMGEVRAVAEALERQTLHTAGGAMHYVVAGRRPS
jgi:ubiquinone/menaquinone biosynthesis C-methylase UbiE